AGHSTEETLAALRGVRPHLAREALIVLDDADWPKVRAGLEQFLAEEARARLAERIDGRAEGQDWWWDGMDLIGWADGRAQTHPALRTTLVTSNATGGLLRWV